MVKLRFHPGANRDFRDAYLYYYSQNPKAAAEFALAIEGATLRIQEAPESFPKRGRYCRMLILSNFPYSVIYRVFADSITVIAIAHGSRKPGYWRNRLA